MYGFVITEKGLELDAKLRAWGQLKLTRVMVGDGTVPEETNPRKLTDLISPFAEASSTAPVAAGASTMLVVEYRSDMNGGLDQDRYINEFGLFAQDPEDGEILYLYGNLGEFREPVRAYKPGEPVITRRYPVSITVADGVDVVLGYLPSVFVTEAEAQALVDAHNVDEKAHQDLRKILSELQELLQKIPSLDDGLLSDTILPNIPTDKLPTVPVNKGGTGKTGWTANGLLYASAATVLAQLGFPSVAGSVLRQGKSGAPYWTSLADLAEALPTISTDKLPTIPTDKLPSIPTDKLPTIPVNKGGTGKTGWTANGLLYASAATVLAQLGFPSVAGSVLRQGTSGAPYWTSLADLVADLGAAGGVRIQTGSYEGTGTYGQQNPCSISFDFSPKLLLIGPTEPRASLVVCSNKQKTVGVIPGYIKEPYAITLAWNASTLSWWNPSQSDYGLDIASYQMNAKDSTYWWVAIG